MTSTLIPPTYQTQPLPSPAPPGRRRPGWGGVIAVGVGAALHAATPNTNITNANNVINRLFFISFLS